jgi:hypothetical protein
MRLQDLTRQILRVAAGGAVLLAFAAPRATATVRVRDEAIKLGYAAGNCGYCHTFDNDHMKQQGSKPGVDVRVLDCYACHKGRLPKTGAEMLNDRGRFLVAAKRHMQREKVVAEWLKTYRDPSPAPPAQPQPKRSPKI